jgi:Rha family phage regulatory protein
MNELEQKTIYSVEVAEMVGKEHSKLLRDIRNYIEQLAEAKIGSGDFFTESKYKDANNQERPCYLVTKKGCEFIAHKMTGVRGTEFTAKYIDRFHEMEDSIKAHIPTGQELIALAVVEAQRMLAQKEEEVKQLQTTVQQMDAVITDMTPKVDYVDKILSSNDCITVTQIAQDYGMSAVRFNSVLRTAGIQRKVGDQWILYADFQGKGYVRTKTNDYVKHDGSTGTKPLTVWTQKGRMFLYNKMKEIGIEPIEEESA